MKPIGQPILAILVAFVATLAATACQDSSPQGTSPITNSPATTTRTSAPPSTPSAGGSNATTTRTSAPPSTPSAGGSKTTPSEGGAEALALQEQVDLILGGNGEGTDCVADLEHLPADFATSPSIWISKAYNTDRPLEYPLHSALCLHGFALDQPIAVRVRAGNFSATTTVRPSSATTDFADYLPPSTLFKRAGDLRVYSVGPDLLMSRMWAFAAVADARSQLARVSRLTLTAEQADRRAVNQQGVTTPTLPDRTRLDGLPAGEVSLLVYGFEPGTVVPIGLYVMSTSDEKAELVARVGTVQIPAARVAYFTAPKGLLKDRPAGDYCLLVPVAEQDGCPFAGTIQ
jgi:hypothetical protein